MSKVDSVFVGEYFEIAGEIFVFSRVGTHTWNFISVVSGQPYSEIPLVDVEHPWWREFSTEELELFFGFRFTSDKMHKKLGHIRKLERLEDFIIRVKDYSGGDFQ